MPIGYSPKDNKYAVKQMVRRISTMNQSIPQEGIKTIYEVDEELDSWIKEGYKLVAVQMMSNDIDSLNVYYCLVKEQ